MKKLLTAILLVAATFGIAKADDHERPTTVDQLPQKAQEFLNTHFKDLQVAFAIEEQKFMGKEYEVIRGAEKTIRKYRPVIICALYHNPVDFFCIKPFLESLNLGYRFAIRRLDIYMPTTDVYLLAYAE